MKWLMFWKKDDWDDDRWEKNLPDTITRSVAKNTVPKIVLNGSDRTDSFAISGVDDIDILNGKHAVDSNQSKAEQEVQNLVKNFPLLDVMNSKPELINHYAELVKKAERNKSHLMLRPPPMMPKPNIHPPPPIPPKPRLLGH